MSDLSAADAALFPFDPNGAATPGSGVFGLLTLPEDARVVLLPVPFDATTSYRRGAARAPAAILEASKQVEIFDLLTGKPYEAGIAMLPEDPAFHALNEEARAAADPIIEVGGLAPHLPELDALAETANGVGDRVNARVYAETSRLLAEGRIPGIVGGDHSVPFGAIQAIAEKFPGVGILHIDAHADLREAYEGFAWSHASIMYNVLRWIPNVRKLVQVGVRDLGELEFNTIASSQGRVVTFFDARMKEAQHAGATWRDQVAEIVAALPDQVYVSFDIDGLDPLNCPHTGTPVPGGLSFSEANALLAAVVASGRRIVGFDLNEVAPGPEGDDWDANVGARMLYRLAGFALLSQGIGSAGPGAAAQRP